MSHVRALRVAEQARQILVLRAEVTGRIAASTDDATSNETATRPTAPLTRLSVVFRFPSPPPPGMSRSLLLSVLFVLACLALCVSAQSDPACPTCSYFRVTFVCPTESVVTATVRNGQTVGGVMEQFNTMCKTNAQALAINAQTLYGGTSQDTKHTHTQHTQRRQAHQHPTAAVCLLTCRLVLCCVLCVSGCADGKRLCRHCDLAERHHLRRAQHNPHRASPQERIDSKQRQSQQ